MNLEELVIAENLSIRTFVEKHADLLAGRVLDYGCGRQPYRPIVEAAGGEYFGFDREWMPANRAGTVGVLDLQPYDAVLCTQVLQFVSDVRRFLEMLRRLLRPSGALVATFTTNWPEVNIEDLHRHTARGMENLLWVSGFKSVVVEPRGGWTFPGYELAFGYGATARA